MIYNNLNRIKGILSARLGAEIPKFTEGGSSPVNLTVTSVDLIDGKYYINNNTNYEITKEQATDLKTKLYKKLVFETAGFDKISDVKHLYYPKTPLELNPQPVNTSVNVEGVTSTTNLGFPTSDVEPEIPTYLLADPIPEYLKAPLNNLNGNKPNTTVIGGTNTDPNGAVKDAADIQNLINNTVLLLEVQVTADNLQEKRQVATLNISPGAMSQPLTKPLIDIPLLTKRDIRQHNRMLQKEKRLLDREDNTSKGFGLSLVGLGLSLGIQAIGGAMGAHQSASDSETTRNITAAWDGAANIASQFGPIGEAVGTVMGLAKGAGDIIQSITGGTDLITKTDQWMSSPLLSWNVGIVNDWFAKKSESLGVDQSTLAAVGSSYGGSSDDILEMSKKADKKIGLLAGKERREINADIAKARSSLLRMRGIADTATDQRLAVQSMGEQAGLTYSMMTDGGYNQKYTYAAKHGGSLEWNPVIELEWKPQVELNSELPTFKEGGSVEFVEKLEWIPELKDGNKLDFDTWFNSIPEEYRADGYDYKKAYEVFDWELLSKHAKDPKNNHLGSVSPVADENGNFPFLKLGTLDENKELQEEFDWYNSEEGKDHKSRFDIKYVGDRYYYIPKKVKDGDQVNLEDIFAYYKDYDLTKVNFIKDFQARTEGNNIYYSSDEDAIHELWHYLSNNQPNDIYKDYYDSLNDDRIIELGGDLQFVKRFENDPGHFYHPSELEARIKAAKFKTKGQNYTKEFFQNLRKDENKYGNNMRDLLHMYNDDNLVKIFSLKKGGSVGDSDIPEIEETNQKNVIPEGALHKNKHHMEHAEGLSKKGIPVVDEDGEQQAEIEHSEIIFTLEVTKKLEEYYEIFYSEESTNKEKEQAALDAGKLLVYQILENTEDRTGLIESCKKGGTLTFKKDTEELIEEVLEWMPTIVVVETEELEESKEEKSKKKEERSEVKKELSEKDKMKEAIREVLIELLIK